MRPFFQFYRIGGGRRRRRAIFCGGARGKFAPAVLLVVEAALAQQPGATLAQSAFAPVARPEFRAPDSLFGERAGLEYLLHTFPARGRQGCRKHGAGVARGAFRRLEKAQFEAFEASRAALGLVSEPAARGEPFAPLPVRVYKFDAEAVGKFFVFRLPALVFRARKYVRVEIEHRKVRAVFHEPLNYRGRARGATRVQQNPAWRRRPGVWRRPLSCRRHGDTVLRGGGIVNFYRGARNKKNARRKTNLRGALILMKLFHKTKKTIFALFPNLITKPKNDVKIIFLKLIKS